jgi:hypothetical protein
LISSKALAKVVQIRQISSTEDNCYLPGCFVDSVSPSVIFLIAMSEQETHRLSPDQIDSFLTHGYVVLPNCFSRAAASEWTSEVWTRLGYDPHDKRTWARTWTNMPAHRDIKVSEFAPKAWSAICELSGGADRVTEESNIWNDAFIVNLGSAKHEGEELRPRELDGWHVDGDSFVHFLDSPDQGLLVIPLWSDVVPNGGGTVVCTEGVGAIARQLYEHPEGVGPGMIPKGEEGWDDYKNGGKEFACAIAKRARQESFHEMTGKVGDVILLHPLMLHSATLNGFRKERIISNPPVILKEPMRFHREDGNYSLVERKTLKELGKERLENWKIVGERQRLVPERVKVWEKMKADEKRRLDAISSKEENSRLDAAHLTQTFQEIKLGA